MNLTIYTVDAFTDRAFSGNPAGVCIVEEPLTDDLMQQIAAEMNLAETAFLSQTSNFKHQTSNPPPLSPPREQGGAYQLRWFTPAVEIKLCGHATLASAHLLYELGIVKPEETIRFQTMSGELTACKVPGGQSGQPHGVVPTTDLIELDFPAYHVQPAPWPKEASKLLGATPISYHEGDGWQLAELDSEATVRTLAPDIRGLHAIGLGHFIATAKATSPEFDIVSRVFVPIVGIDEDPVTGAAHCALAPYWTKKTQNSKPKTQNQTLPIPPAGGGVIRAYQASKRGGKMEIEWIGERVKLRGQAVTILKAEMLIR